MTPAAEGGLARLIETEDRLAAQVAAAEREAAALLQAAREAAAALEAGWEAGLNGELAALDARIAVERDREIAAVEAEAGQRRHRLRGLGEDRVERLAAWVEDRLLPEEPEGRPG